MKRSTKLQMKLAIIVLCAVAGGIYFGLQAPSARSIDMASLPAASAKGYNLLFISVDTLRADHLSCYGYAKATTPAIDSLCDRGLRYERALAVAPLTMPSHSSMMTGLYSPTHGVRANGVFKLDGKFTTLAEILTVDGYETAAFVAAHVLDSRYGLDQGFATYDDELDEGSGGEGYFAQRRAAKVTDAFQSWLATQKQDKPFFAWLHYFDAHAPYEAPAEFAGTGVHPYDAEIAYIDSQIARVLKILEERGQRDNTLIVFTSDHGESLGEHGETTHSIFVYDATIRVPLIFSAPGLFDGPYLYDQGVASIVDLLPTLTTLLGVPLMAGVSVEGIDLVAQAPDEQRTVYIESFSPRLEYGWASLHGLSRLHQKYIKAPVEEYYELGSDPGEVTNRFGAGSSDELAQELEQMMSKWESEDEALERQMKLDPQQLARLQNLGYMRSMGTNNEVGTKDPKVMVKMWSRIGHAETLSFAKRHQEAVAAIRAVLQEDQQNSKAWYSATRIYRLAGNEAAAYKAIEIAVALSPRADGYVTLATYHFKNNKIEESKKAVRAAVAMDPLNGGIYLLQGDILAMQRQYLEARKAFERVIELDPARYGVKARQKIALIDQRLQSTEGNPNQP